MSRVLMVMACVLTGTNAASAVAVAAIQAPAPATAQVTVTPAEREALMRDGLQVFGRDCAECHAEGGIGAALAGDAKLADTDKVVTRILTGTTDGAMEAFGASLNDRDVAAVATYIRNSWNNAFGPVAEADVKRVRAALPKKAFTTKGTRPTKQSR